MKKIILLLAFISCQTMAYPTSISEVYPLDKKELSIQKNDETDVIDTFEYNKNLEDIYNKLSKKQKEEFVEYLNIYRDSTYKLLDISLDKHLLVVNDVLENKITIDKIYLDYIFYKYYPKFIKSYFTLQSIIKYENPKLFEKNIENAKNIEKRLNKVDSYVSHLENVKKQILYLIENDKNMEDIDQYIKDSFKTEKEKFKNSIDKDKIAVVYNYIQYGINQYNDEELSLKLQNNYLEFFNDKNKETYW